MIWSSLFVVFLSSVSVLASTDLDSNIPLNNHPRFNRKASDDILDMAYRQATRDKVIKTLTRSRHSVARRALVSPSPPPPTINYAATKYTLFHSGSGYIETDENPSNTYGAISASRPPKTAEYPGSTTTQLQAITNCATLARNPEYYYAFQIYYRSDTDSWTCRTYYHLGIGGRADSSSEYFSVPLPEAGPVYGYQVQA